ncbi:discoidin domain-containing protein [Sporolactobacillus shoreicorticis]|uniref:Discoidin domain-containing protein n=1 Tax=Sporolactobacillus shoreicorticis TaxID=1923877 RepID=A0ABW5S9U8_9BACL|nr:discoidin domain-containing protein [Sporolactobacillus shoreicorticis]MCO7127901.1 discoidin domain-containing protein [Sporolactobacillus shoreicorticis]
MKKKGELKGEKKAAVHGDTVDFKTSRILKATVLILSLMLLFSLRPLDVKASEDTVSLHVLATPFKIQGEKKADNIKLDWNAVTGASSYTLSSSSYKKGKYKQIATPTSSTYEIYGLKHRTYYRVQALDAKGNVLATSEVISGKPVNCRSRVSLNTFDNTKTSSIQGLKSKFRMGKNYYQFGFERADDGSLTMWQSTSKDGITYGTKKAVALIGAVDELKSCKLESVGAQQRSDGTIVIWAHYENRTDYTLARVINISGKPGGPFTVHASFRPQGNDSRDLNFYVDDNGNGYLISAAHGNQDINIYKLTDDWMEVLPEQVSPAITVLKGQRREAPALIKQENWYYLFSSEAAGWYPSACKYIAAPTIQGLADAPLRQVGNTSTFGTQSGGIFMIGNTAVMAANRWSNSWKYPDPITAGSRLMPLALKDGYAAFDYYQNIEYNVEKGIVIPVQAGENLSLGKPVVANQSTAANAGFEATKANDGISYDSSNYYQSVAGVEPWTWTVDLGQPSLINEIDITFKRVNGSETYQSYLLEGSNDGVHFVTLKDCTDNKVIGFNENEINNTDTFRYVRIKVNNSTNVNNGQSASWARGINELTVYGSPVIPNPSK